MIETSTNNVNWMNAVTVSTLKTSTNLTSSYPFALFSFFNFLHFIPFIPLPEGSFLLLYSTNGTCVYVPYSTVIQCNVFIKVPSGLKYNVRARALNAFGMSPLGDATTVISAGNVNRGKGEGRWAGGGGGGDGGGGREEGIAMVPSGLKYNVRARALNVLI